MLSSTTCCARAPAHPGEPTVAADVALRNTISVTTSLPNNSLAQRSGVERTWKARTWLAPARYKYVAALARFKPRSSGVGKGLFIASPSVGKVARADVTASSVGPDREDGPATREHPGKTKLHPCTAGHTRNVTCD